MWSVRYTILLIIDVKSQFSKEDLVKVITWEFGITIIGHED